LLNKTNSETNLARSRQGLEIAKTAAAAAALAAIQIHSRLGFCEVFACASWLLPLVIPSTLSVFCIPYVLIVHLLVHNSPTTSDTRQMGCLLDSCKKLEAVVVG
jgi:hypothetical protein